MVTNIDRATLLNLIANDAQLIDVLPEAEFASGHIPGAINIPLRQLDIEATKVLKRDKPVVVY